MPKKSTFNEQVKSQNKQDIIQECSENSIPSEYINKIFCKSSEDMRELPDNSVHIVITSPPYNVGKEYDKDMSIEEYRSLLSRVWKECKRVLVPGGRICINIANIGRKPYMPMHVFITEDMLKLGWLMRGEIIWNKGASVGASTAWGSWLSAKNPILRDVHEYILIFSKDTFSRDKTNKKSTISKEEFLEFTKSVWNIQTASAKRIGHPAPFPLELPYRLIQLYTFENDVVLDPFIGSGQTAIAALKTNRKYVGYEIKEDYVKICEKRIQDFVLENNKIR